MTKIYEEELSDIGLKDELEIDEPKKFKVLLHNDDYTTMEFVVSVLQEVFNKTSLEAHEIMMRVHEKGVGVCGIYCYEVAETKAQKVEVMAKNEGHPLKISIEEDE